MRRVAAPLFALIALAAPRAITGCATSAADAETHGPVFVLDSGEAIDADGGALDDATSPPASNDATTNDAPSTQGDDAGAIDADTDAANAGDDAGNGVDASDAGACTSPTAVLAGSSASLVGALAVGSGAFATEALAGSATFAPAIVATGSGFEALVASSVDAGGGGALLGVGLSGSTWSAPASIGASTGAIDAPAVAALGSTLEGIYLNAQHLYFHAHFAGTSWDTGADAVLPLVDGGTQSFGPVRASAAATGNELVIAFEGNDAHLYAQSWTQAGGWQSAVKIGSGTLATNTAPAIVALDSGANDLLVVYVEAGDTKIEYALRDAAGKTWSTPALTNTNAFTSNAASLAPMSGGRAIVGWRGTDGRAYTMAFTSTPSAAWTAPAEIGTLAVATAPSLAIGTCGHDAVAAVVSSGGVSVATYASGAWGSPAGIAGISGAAFVAIATRP